MNTAPFLQGLFWFFGFAHLLFGAWGLGFPHAFFAAVPPWPPFHAGQIQIAGIFDLSLAALYLGGAYDFDRYLPMVVVVGIVGEGGHAAVRLGHVLLGDNPKADTLLPMVMMSFAVVLAVVGLRLWRESAVQRNWQAG